MALASVTTIMPLLLRITAGDFFERVKAGIGWKENRCIYSFGVVLTLMILQRATGRKTLSRTVGLAVAVADGKKGCQRLRRGQLSSNTGAYSRARSRLPRPGVERAMAQMLEQLQQPELAGKGQPFYILDGSSVLLAHEPELVEAFAAGRNQNGMSH